jgi:hypothetical protein
MVHKCPGQNPRNWTPSDIFEVECKNCGEHIEFFKDDSSRPCRCGYMIINPKLYTNCMKWCPSAEQCLLGKL